MSGSYGQYNKIRGYANAVISGGTSATSRATVPPTFSSSIPSHNFSYPLSGLTGSTLSSFDKPSSGTPTFLSGRTTYPYSAPLPTPLLITSSSFNSRSDNLTSPMSAGAGRTRGGAHPVSVFPTAPPPPDPHSPLTSESWLQFSYNLTCDNCRKYSQVRLLDYICRDCARKKDDSKNPSNPSAVPSHSQNRFPDSKSDAYPYTTSTTSISSSQPARSDTRAVSSSSWTPQPQSRPTLSSNASPPSPQVQPSNSRDRNYVASGSASSAAAAAERERQRDSELEAMRQRQEHQLPFDQPDVAPRAQNQNAPNGPLPPIEFVSVPALRKWPTPDELDRNRLLESSPTMRQLFEAYKKLVCLRGRAQQQAATEPRAEQDTHRSSCATADVALEQRAREMVVCGSLIKKPLPQRLLSPDLARAFFVGLLSWLAEVDALAVAFSPVCRDQCSWKRFEERFPHALRLPPLVRFEHLLRRLELHLCLLIRRGPFVPEMALIDANSPLLIELQALFPKFYKQLLESAGYEAREEQTAEEPSAFASDASTAFSLQLPRDYDPAAYQTGGYGGGGGRGRPASFESETLSAHQSEQAQPKLVLEARETELLSRVRECFVLRYDKMVRPDSLERYMSTWLALAFDCFVLGELVRTANEMRLAPETRADLGEDVPREHPLNALHHCRTSLYLLLMLAMGVAKTTKSSGGSSLWDEPKLHIEDLTRNTCERFQKMRINFGKELFSLILGVVVENRPDNYCVLLTDLFDTANAVNREHYSSDKYRFGDPSLYQSASASASSSRPSEHKSALVDPASAAAGASVDLLVRAQYMKQQKALNEPNLSGASRASTSPSGGSASESDRVVGLLKPEASGHHFDNAVIAQLNAPSGSSHRIGSEANRNRPLPPYPSDARSSSQDTGLSGPESIRPRRTTSQDVRQQLGTTDEASEMDTTAAALDEQASIKSFEVVSTNDSSSEFDDALPDLDIERQNAAAEARLSSGGNKPGTAVRSSASSGTAAQPAAWLSPQPAASGRTPNKSQQAGSSSSRSGASSKNAGVTPASPPTASSSKPKQTSTAASAKSAPTSTSTSKNTSKSGSRK